MEKRTKIDFSKHELQTITHDGVLIHILKKPGTFAQHLRFINTQGIMAVTGDYGNWIFCREFHPAKGGYVSDQYWLEKLRISSEQDGEEFDEEGTEAVCRERIADEDYSDRAKEFFGDCIRYVYDGEASYTSWAYHNNPGLDYESIPHVKKVKYWLLSVFDAFEEICDRQPALEALTAVKV